MNNTWLRSILSGEEAKGTREAAKGDVISAPTLNITKFVSIFVLIFAAITQVLAWIGAITLSTTQQVTIWLIVAGLMVLLAIADMACRAYVTAKRYEASAARPRAGQSLNTWNRQRFRLTNLTNLTEGVRSGPSPRRGMETREAAHGST